MKCFSVVIVAERVGARPGGQPRLGSRLAPADSAERQDSRKLSWGPIPLPQGCLDQLCSPLCFYKPPPPLASAPLPPPQVGSWLGRIVVT